MKRCLLPLLFLALGCAHPGPSAEEWFNEQAAQWVEQVQNSCEATHWNFAKSRSPIDCRYNGQLDLQMNFPNMALFEQNNQGLTEFVGAWCVAVGNHTGDLPQVQLLFREEGKGFSLSCDRLLDRNANGA